MSDPRGEEQLRAATQSMLDGGAPNQWSELENELQESERNLALTLLGCSPGSAKAEMLAQIFDNDEDSTITLDDGFPVLFAGLDEATASFELTEGVQLPCASKMRTKL